MKIVARVLIGVVALLALVVVALALLLPSIVASQTVRDQIQVAAADALGRELSYEELGFSLLPLSLVVVEPVIAGERAGDAPFLEARAISLELALLPLLARAVVVDALVVEGGVVRLVRTEEGVALPGPPEESAEEAVAGEPDGDAPAQQPESEAPPAEGGSGFQLAVRKVELRDTRVVFDDLASSPPASWVIDPIDATAVGTSLDEPVAVHASAVIESGGTVTLDGSVSPDGELDLEIALARLILDPVSAYLGDDVSLAGALEGVIVVKGPAASPGSVGLDLTLAETRVDAAGAAVLGVLSLEAELLRPAEELAGTFRIDAGDAEIRSGDTFAKPRGTTATLAGRIETGKDGALHLEDLDLELHQLTARSRVELGDSTRVGVSAADASLAGWEPLVPALAGTGLSGAVRVEDLEIVLEPLGVRGRIEIVDGGIALADTPPVSFRGAIVAAGDSLIGEGIAVGSADQELAVGLRIRDLFGTLVLDLDVRGADLDSNRLVTEFAGQPDTVLGPLDVAIALDGPLGGEGDLVGVLRGDVDASIDGGRIVGFSPLRQVFDQVGGLGSAAAQLAQVFTRKSIEQYYGDDFERASAVLRLAGGVLHDDLRIKYRGYSVVLTGTADPVSLELDNTGTLILAAELDGIIARELGARDYDPHARSIPLAAVTGPMYDPKVEVAREPTARFVASYASDVYGATARKAIENEAGKHVGDAAGKALGDAAGGLLGDLLGGKKKQD